MGSKSELLFSRQLRLYDKSSNDIQRVVRINVELLSASSPVGEKSVRIEVTDEEDPLFYYGLLINQEEFRCLKSHQNLLIEFTKFPEQLVQLLKLCCTEAEVPKYILVLEHGECESVLQSHHLYLKFVEQNEFKHLCHLSLKVGNPTTDEIKAYLSSRIKNMMESASKNDKKICLLESELSRASSDLAAARIMQDEFKKKWADERNALEITHVKEITAEREKLADAKLIWQKEEEQRKSKEQKDVNDRIRRLELEIASLRSQYNETRDKLSAAKEQNFILNEELSAKTKEVAELRQDLPCLKKQNLVLDTDYHEKEKQLNILRAEHLHLKEELKIKTAEVADYLQEIQLLNSSKAELQKYIDDKVREYNSLLARNEELEQDITKANSIIVSLQKQLDDIHREFLTKKALIVQQNKIISRKEKALMQFGSEVNELVDRIKSLELCRDDLDQQLRSTAAQLSVKDQELANNRNVIGWLNRKLTESQVMSPAGPVTASTPYRGFISDSSTRPVIPGQPITNPCWQSLKPRWWSDNSARFPSANVRWTSPHPVVPTYSTSAAQGAPAVQGAHAAQDAPAVQNAHAAHAVQSEQVARGEAIAQGEAISQLGGPQETETKTAGQVEHAAVAAHNLGKKPKEPSGFSRGTVRPRSVRPKNTPSSYFPGAV